MKRLIEFDLKKELSRHRDTKSARSRRSQL